MECKQRDPSNKQPLLSRQVAYVPAKPLLPQLHPEEPHPKARHPHFTAQADRAILEPLEGPDSFRRLSPETLPTKVGILE